MKEPGDIIWQEEDERYPINGGFQTTGDPRNSNLYVRQNSYGIGLHPQQQHQTPSEVDNFTVLPMGNGNFLKVYHNNDETAMNFNNYELFASNNFVAQNMLQNQQQPMQEKYYRNSCGGERPTTNENSNNMFINQLVENWTPNLSGTYSPFGEPLTNLPPRENLLGYNLPPMNQPQQQQQELQETFNYQQQSPVAQTSQNFNYPQPPPPQQRIEDPIKNNNPSILNSSGTNGSLQHERVIKKNEVKKPRMVAEVKPMRMTYSDVLSKNVFINDKDANSSNSGSSSSGANHQTYKSSKMLGDKGNKGNGYEKKSNSNAGGGSSNAEDRDLMNTTAKTKMYASPKNDEQITLSQLNSAKDSKTNNNPTADDEYKENKIYDNEMKNSKKKLTGKTKFKTNTTNTTNESTSKKRASNSAAQSEFSMKNDDMGRESKGTGFFYNITKNEMQSERAKSYQNITTARKPLKISSNTLRSNSKSEKLNSYQKRNQQRIRQNDKYAIMTKLLEKWFEYTQKILFWLAALVYDVVVLSCGMIWERMYMGWEYMCQLYERTRKELQNSSGLPTAYCKKLWQQFDKLFEKDSKWAVWRKIFNRKKSPEPTAVDHGRNERLPTTGDEAMYSLLNCKGKDAYSILGVSSDCSQEQIRKHYKKIAVLVHPDKNKQAGAEEAFKILQRAFELIGEPENRKAYDQSLAEALNAEKNWSEINDLLTQLQTKIAEAANTIRCSSCGLRHPRRPTGRPHFAARECNSCKIRHSAREGDIWAETSVFGFRWKYLALMEGKVYDITEWANCQKGALSHLQPNSHIVQYRIVLGSQQQQQQQQQKEQQERERAKHAANEPTLDDFLDNLYSGQNPQSQNASKRRSRKNAN